MNKNKRGAIELSMTTIIVIVIGVTLLILGLAWVRGMFEKITDISNEQLEAAKIEVAQNMKASDKFYIAGTTIKVEPGKVKSINVGVQNIEDKTAEFSYDIEVGSGASKDWFTLPLSENIEAGEIKSNVINVFVPKGTGLSVSYPVKFIIKKDNQEYSSSAIMVHVA